MKICYQLLKLGTQYHSSILKSTPAFIFSGGCCVSNPIFHFPSGFISGQKSYFGRRVRSPLLQIGGPQLGPAGTAGLLKKIVDMELDRTL